jgi:glycosyltransferase involved in cell wall biosynthesis
MRVFWSVNLLLPDIAQAEGLPVYPLGGWLVGLSSVLAGREDIKLAIAALYPGKQLKKRELNNIIYYLIPKNKKNLSVNWKLALDEFRPEIIHIHGTESSHNYSLIKVCGHTPVVVSIQGIISSIEKQYYAGMEFKDLFLKPTFRDIAKFDTLPLARRKFKKQSETEIKMLNSIQYVIGRTPWDYANIKAINPGLHYLHCDEALRETFYKFNYDLSKAVRHTIFVSQASYPIKGFHILLKAAALLKKDFPDIKIYVAGQDMLGKSFKQKIKISGYGQYVKNLINKLGLEDNVQFAGHLNESEMVTRLLKSHVFVLPSSIENSSNSLAEAMLIGVPCVAAYTGGTPSMLEEGKCGLLYPFMEYPMLAENIRKLFNDDELANELSMAAQQIACSRHDRKLIASQTFQIYCEIIEKRGE